MDRDKLKEKIARALCPTDPDDLPCDAEGNVTADIPAWTYYVAEAEAALTAIEDAGIDLCQANSTAVGETVSAPTEPLQSTALAEAEERESQPAWAEARKIIHPLILHCNGHVDYFGSHCSQCKEATARVIEAMRKPAVGADAYTASLIESLIRRDAWVTDDVLERISQTAEDQVAINSIITPNAALAILSARDFLLNRHVSQIEEPANAGDEVSQHTENSPDTYNQDSANA